MKKLLPIFFITALFCSCNRSSTPDISSIKITLSIERFEKDLFSLNYEHIADSVIPVKNKYGEFFDLYTNKVIHIGTIDNPMFPELLKSFITDYTMNEVNDEVSHTFISIDSIQDIIIPAFKRFHFFFPEKPIPHIYTFISGFNQSIVTTDTILGIGLDKYLGAKHPFYERLGLSSYIRANMNPSKIPSDVMKAWIMTQFEKNDSVDNLLSNMIYQGKILYLTKLLLPDSPDSLIIGYSQDKIEWCKRNEDRMWTSLVEHKTLFVSDYLTINKFCADAPYTKEFTTQSPGRAATWIGWKIVESFIKRNPDITPKQLLEINDSQEILRKSKYRP